MVVLLAPNCELESGFNLVVRKINSILKQVGNNAVIYGQAKTIDAFTTLNKDKKREFYNIMHVFRAEQKNSTGSITNTMTNITTTTISQDCSR